MAAASMTYREIRFVIEPELTQVYVYLDAHGDAPLGVEGWHHKTFPPDTSCADILDAMIRDHPVLWPQAAPEKGGA